MSAAEEPVDLTGARARRTVNALLERNESGTPYKTIGNLIMILRHDDRLKGLITLNEFTHATELTRSPPMPEPRDRPLPGPYPRPWNGADEALILAYVQKEWMSMATEAMLRSAMVAVASMQGIHPVRDWLATLEWDQTNRLDTWLTKAFGIPDTSYTREIGAKFLIAAVRRIRQPGCKFDYMLILEGAQGIGKSTALAKLFSPEWFSDSLMHDLANKDAAIGLLGVWCVELGEIDQIVRTEVETIKAFLARSTDRYRPPFGRTDVSRPRQGVLVGTTNRDDYLRDDTGNRRFWPAKCAFANVKWIEENREQLWAQAAEREEFGASIWLQDVAVAAEAQKHQTERLVDDVWAEKVVAFIGSRQSVKVPEVLTECLSVPLKDQDKRAEMRVASILRREGWSRTLRREGATTHRFWVKFPPLG